jgi:hypothetical protein
MHVGRLEVMSNVVGAVPLFVHRSGDAKGSFVSEPNDEDLSGAAALCHELPESHRCIADQVYLDSALADDTTTAIPRAQQSKAHDVRVSQSVVVGHSSLIA